MREALKAAYLEGFNESIKSKIVIEKGVAMVIVKIIGDEIQRMIGLGPIQEAQEHLFHLRGVDTYLRIAIDKSESHYD